jgi:hypothetical protein
MSGQQELLDEKTFRKRLKSIKNRGVKVHNELNDIVRASIELYYGESNQNIALINGVLEVAYMLRGINSRLLMSYYKEVIPHHVTKNEKGQQVFGKKDRQKEVPNWRGFLEENPEWHEFKKEKEPEGAKAFSVSEYFDSTVAKRLEKEVGSDPDALRLFKQKVEEYVNYKLAENERLEELISRASSPTN